MAFGTFDDASPLRSHDTLRVKVLGVIKQEIRVRRSLQQADAEFRVSVEKIGRSLELAARNRAGVTIGAQCLVPIHQLRRLVVLEVAARAAHFAEHAGMLVNAGCRHMPCNLVAGDTGAVRNPLECGDMAGAAVLADGRVRRVNRAGL